MKVRAGAKPNGKVIEVELDDGDFENEEGWEAMSLAQRWKYMTNRADMMLVEYMLRHGDISRDYAEQRIREIKGAQ